VHKPPDALRFFCDAALRAATPATPGLPRHATGAAGPPGSAGRAVTSQEPFRRGAPDSGCGGPGGQVARWPGGQVASRTVPDAAVGLPAVAIEGRSAAPGKVRITDTIADERNPPRLEPPPASRPASFCPQNVIDRFCAAGVAIQERAGNRPYRSPGQIQISLSPVSSAARSSASVSPSRSAEAALRNQVRPSSVRPAATSASA
jgi:hypothetical protein